MRNLIIIIFLITVVSVPAFAQANPSLVIKNIEVPHYEFNKVARDAVIVELDQVHALSWQVTIDNNLVYANPNGNAVIRFYDNIIPDKFVEIGMGSQPDEKFWVAVQLPDMGYVVIHDKLERGWVPHAKSIISYTDRAGMTVNNGERIVVSNLDVSGFEIKSYSVHGMESSTDPPAVSSGTLTLEILSGDPSENPLQMFPFYLGAGIGVIVAVLLLTKKRSQS